MKNIGRVEKVAGGKEGTPGWRGKSSGGNGLGAQFWMNVFNVKMPRKLRTEDEATNMGMGTSVKSKG